ncbi:DUF3131 domain-containing protein [Ferrimonas kyonanensis]|uniref:DUF3131 domain-containing protein n=1 Tax=Ferrimonas kyonanensis TaxID=364763 RepID=UPI00041DCE45|nr:DUF3131 domain-containing protein [Ferrimonas kyonanensis]
MRLWCLMLTLVWLPGAANDDPPSSADPSPMRLSSKAQASARVSPASGDVNAPRLSGSAQLSRSVTPANVPAPTSKVITQGLTPSPLPQDRSQRASDQPRFARLLPIHRQMAQSAWRYFSSQYQADTGMINSVYGYKETTLWDVGSALAGTVAAAELGLITPSQFQQRLSTLLTTLATMPLYDDLLPARSYRTDSGQPAHDSDRHGNGWSVLDIARTLTWLAIIDRRHPQFRSQITAITQRWQLSHLVHQGELIGARYHQGRERRYQEGRYGYEQYAAAGLAQWQLETHTAFDYSRLPTGQLMGIRLPLDRRNLPFLTSDPFYLAQLELGQLRQEGQQILEIHRRQWQQQQRLWCFGEDASNHPPWFLYNNLSFADQPWHSTDYRGQATDTVQVLSAKCALSWAVLSDDDFGTELWHQARALYRPTGWLTGRYQDGTVNSSSNLNTHAVVLTALLYIHNGNRALLLPPLP